MAANGVYFDGKTARSHPVTLHLEPGLLVLTAEDGTRLTSWPLASIRAPNGIGHYGGNIDLIPRWGAEERLRTDDGGFVDRLVQQAPGLQQRRPRDWSAIRKAVLWSGTAVGALAFIIFVAVPALAPRIALMIPPEREIAFGEQVNDLLLSVGMHDGACSTPGGDAALAKMTARLTENMQLRIPLKVTVVRSDIMNAIALPGGRVMLFDPLVQDAQSPEEVAGVLAHEIGHVQQAHPTREAIRASAASAVIGLIFGDFTGAGVLALAGDRLINTSYSREAEREADDFAVARLDAVDVSPEGLAQFMGRLGDAGGDASLLGGWFATHPSFGEREADLRAAADRSDDDGKILNDEEWTALRNICKTNE